MPSLPIGTGAFAVGAAAIFHASLNRNKRSVALDLKLEADKASLAALIETADVFMEGFRPGTMQRLGFGYRR